MPTYEPLPFPRRPKTSTFFSELQYQAQLLQYRYEINTGLYVMSPGEKLAFNVFHLILVTLLLIAAYYCMPIFMVRGLHQLAGSIGSKINGSAQGMEIGKAILQSGFADEHAAGSGFDRVVSNASVVSNPWFGNAEAL